MLNNKSTDFRIPWDLMTTCVQKQDLSIKKFDLCKINKAMFHHDSYKNWSAIEKIK